MLITERPAHRGPAEAPFADTVAVEEPLEIRVEGEPLAVLLRTPGADLALVAGFLRSEGIVEDREDLSALAPVGTSGNVVEARLASGVAAHRDAIERATRQLFATSSCGLCGKQSIDRIHTGSPPLDPQPPLDPEWVLALPARLASYQPGFDQTGGLHAALLLLRDGTVLAAAEDIGRHNAVDKVIGQALLDGRDADPQRVLVVSSRAGFEIVQKALADRIGVVVAVGAASQLAIDLARESGLALYAFVRPGRYNRYA